MELKRSDINLNFGKSDYNSIIYEFVRNTNLANKAPLWKYAELYGTNSIIYSLVNYKAQKASQIKPMIYKVKDAEAEKEFRKWNGKAVDAYEKKKFKEIKSAGVDEIYLSDIRVTDGNLFRLKKLLTRPNKEQKFSDLIYGLSAFEDIAGWSLLHKGVVGKELAALYFLPTTKVTIEGGTPEDPIKSYVYDGWQKRAFAPEDCIKLGTFSLDYDKMGSHLYGTSKVGVIYDQIQTYIETKAMEYAYGKSGGSVNIVFPKNLPEGTLNESNAPGLFKGFLEDFKQSLRKMLRFNTTLNSFELGHINLASVLKDADSKQVKEDIYSMAASVWQVSARLALQLQAGATYNNMVEDMKSSLRNGVFPTLNRIEETFQYDIVEPYFNVELAFDYDCYEELNTNTIDEMAKLKDVDFLSDDEKRDWFDFDVLNDERASKPQKYWDIVLPPDGFANNSMNNDTSSAVQ